MTVASETAKSGPYNGNGSTKTFNYTFKIAHASHLRVILRDADGTRTDLIYNTDYTVAGAGSPSGGTITLVNAPDVGQTLTILRDVPFVQETDLENQGAYYAETIEDALDMAAMRDQQMAEELQRAVKVPAGANDPGGELADKLAQGILTLYPIAPEIEAVGDNIGAVETVSDGIAAVQNVSANMQSIIEASGSVLSLRDQSYVATSGQAEFTLPVRAFSTENVLVWLDGVRQIPNTDYSVDGVTLSFASPLTSGQAVDVLVIGAVSMQDVKTQSDRAVEAADRIDLGALDDAVEQTGLDRAAAVNAKDAAQIAQTQAESARDAAFINANVYPDVATGLAAVADGEQFQVVDGDEIIRYRRDSASTQTEVARYPAASYAQKTQRNLTLLQGSSQQVIGREGTPVHGGGAAASDHTGAILDPVKFNGTITRVRCVVTGGATDIKIKVFRPSEHPAPVVQDVTVPVVPGLNILTVSIPVEAGDYLGWYVVGGRIGYVTSSYPNADMVTSMAGDQTATFNLSGSVETVARLAIGFDLQSSSTAPVSKRDLDIINARSAAATASQKVIQTLGRPVEPIEGAPSNNAPWVFVAPVTHDGYITRLRVWSLGAGPIEFAPYAQHGVMLERGQVTTLQLVDGLNDLSVANGDFAPVPIRAGERIGWYMGTRQSTTASTPGDSGGIYNGGTGNILKPIIRAASPFTGSRVEIGFEIEQVVSLAPKLLVVTQSEYDALPVKDAQTLYVVT